MRERCESTTHAHHALRAPDSESLAKARSQAGRMRDVLQDCVRRRAAGEALPDDELICAFPELMPALARELALLRVLKRASRDAESGTDGSSCDGAATVDLPLMRPDAIPGYHLIRELRRGGQGIVYAARQASTCREVAIKILHSAAFAGPSDRTRFQREIRLLARLRHPNIVTIHDTGVAGGTPYYVMDLIEGVPLDRQWAGRPVDRPLARRELREALALFAKICEAVHAAHLRGVIHRDLKPGNVLLDAAGEPHVLDFGLAKDLADASPSSVTGEGQFVGSIPWASPEQVGGGADMDVRSDVYSLGVMLFQSLTGRFPYRVAGPLAEVFRTIATEPPLRPGALQRAVDRDLDTIVLKSLSKEPERRYQSAGELARDVRNYLAGRPIDARRDSGFYVLRTTLRRHRAIVGLVGLAAAGTLAFSAYQSAQNRRLALLATEETAARISAQAALRRAETAEQKAAAERDEAQRARDGEVAQRQIAQSQAERAESVTDFLVVTLRLADPDVTQPLGADLRSMLDGAAAQVGSALAGQPASEADVRLVIGRAYATLGDLDAAVEQLRRALELHETVLQSGAAESYEVLRPYVQVLEELGARDYVGQRAKLWRMYAELVRPWDARLPAVLAAWRERMGEKYEAAAFQSIEAEFFRIADEAVPQVDPRWLVIADFLRMGGSNLTLRDFPEPGRAVLRRALEIERRFLPETHTRIIRTLGELVRSSIDAGLHEEAEALTRESLALVRRALPADHWYISVYQARLGACLIGQSRFAEAESLLLTNLAQIEAARGTTNAFAREVVERLIDLYEAWGRPDSAEPWRLALARRVVASDQESRPSNRLRRIFGPKHAELFDALDRFNWSRIDPEGVTALHALLPLRRQQIPDDDVRAAVVAECLCAAASVLGNRNTYNDDTLAMAREAERIARAADHLHPRKKAYILWNVARQLEPRGEFRELERVSREVLDIIEPLYGASHSLALNARLGIGVALLGQGRPIEAEPLLVADFERRLARGGPAHAETRAALLRLIDLYQALGRPEAALPHACAVSRGQWLDWKDIRSIFAAKYPRVFESMEALASLQTTEIDRIAVALRALQAARRDAFEPVDPAAMVYAGALHRLARARATWTIHPVWIPAQLEVREISLAHMPADWNDLATVSGWLATLMIRSGACAEAERYAREALEITRKHTPDSPWIAIRERALAGALIGQGRLAEAEPLLMRSIDMLLGPSLREPFSSECFGYLLAFCVSSGRPEESERLLAPILRGEMERRADAFLLRRLVTHLVRQPALPPRLYELAAEAARIATELAPNNQYVRMAACAADYRLGRIEAALAGLDGLQPSTFDAPMHAAMTAMARHRMGDADGARTALARCRSLLDALGGAALAHDRALLREAEDALGEPRVATDRP